MEGDVIEVKDFTNRVQSELLPLNKGEVEYPKYESVNLADELRGPVAGYKEHVYESPITTSAGNVHFSNTGVKTEKGVNSPKKYFAHTRIEDLPALNERNQAIGFIQRGDETRKQLAERTKAAQTTRRVIEIQSDLFQKGRWEDEFPFKNFDEALEEARSRGGSELKDKIGAAKNEAEAQKLAKQWMKETEEGRKLEPYRNNWWERVVREEVRQAAKDGKTKLQFPTGETAMNIEGLGSQQNWYTPRVIHGDTVPGRHLDDNSLKVGQNIFQGGHAGADEWIIIDVLGDGKFKAVPKDHYIDADSYSYAPDSDDAALIAGDVETMERYTEAFDISGKVDTNSTIYRFYEKDVQKYLTKKYGGKVITDPQGVTWIELDVPKDAGKLPVEAFGAGLIPLVSEREE